MQHVAMVEDDTSLWNLGWDCLSQHGGVGQQICDVVEADQRDGPQP
jgi:hypothetical protein